jgi:hypothetical protein
MPKLEITEIEKQLNSCFGARELDRCGRQNGLEYRQHRGIPTSGLVCSLLASLGSRRVETLAELHRDFQAAHESTVYYKPFYEKLDRPGFGRVMKAVFESILRQLSPKILAPAQASPLSGLDGIIIHDGTSVGLHEGLAKAFPSRFTKLHPAGAELHVTMSLWHQAPIKVQIAPDKEAERQFLPSPNSLRNMLLLADRGYDGLPYCSQVDRAGGFFAVRIRSLFNPIVVRVLSGSRRLRRQVGRPLKEALAHASTSGPSDLMVTFPARAGCPACTFRLVVQKHRPPKKGRRQKDSWMRLLTNLGPERLTTQQVQQAYRLRWQIELFFKELKSHANLQPFCTRKKHIAEGLFWASLCAAALKRYFAHACQLNRQIASISPRRVALCAHTFLGAVLRLVQTNSRALQLALERALAFLAVAARRSNPARERRSGLLALNLAPCGVP